MNLQHWHYYIYIYIIYIYIDKMFMTFFLKSGTGPGNLLDNWFISSTEENQVTATV